jgi:hypothetical protein
VVGHIAVLFVFIAWGVWWGQRTFSRTLTQ